MAAYQDTPASVQPDQEGRTIQRPSVGASIKAKSSSFYGGLVWFIISIGTLSYLSGLSDQRLSLAQDRSGYTALFFQPDGTQIVAFWIATVLAMIVLNLRMQLVTKLTALALLFAAMVGSSAVLMTGYETVTRDQVLIHSPLPWHRDVTVALVDARVMAKGCHHYHNRSGTHRRIIFQIQGGPGGGQKIDLGDVAERNLGAWLSVMQGYDNGTLPLAADAGANAPHDPACLEFWSTGLDQRQQAELAHLLS